MILLTPAERERRVTMLVLRIALEFPDWDLEQCYEIAETVVDLSGKMVDELEAERRQTFYL